MIRLIQWNCRGIHGKLTEFKNLICNYDIACLQETWLGCRDPLPLSEFLSFTQDRPIDQIGGGTAVVCKSNLDPSTIPLTGMEALELEVSAIVLNKLSFYNKRLAIISIYKPPNIFLRISEWNCFFDHIRSLSNSFSLIMCGDFNSHHSSWGSSLSNSEGSILADILASSDFVFLNNGSSTRVSANIRHHSVPDLTSDVQVQ